MTKWNTSNLFYKWRCTTTTFLLVLVAATLKSNRDATWHFKILHLAINSVSRTADVSHISVMAIIKSIGHGINAWYSVASASLFHLLPNGKKQLLKVLAVNFHSRKRNHAQCPSCYCWSSTFKETSSLSCCWFRTLELLGSHFRNLSGQNLQKKMQQQKSSDRMGAFQMWKSWTVVKSNKQPEKKKEKDSSANKSFFHPLFKI